MPRYAARILAVLFILVPVMAVAFFVYYALFGL